MRLAIAEGHKGIGFVAPNPLVGCVILDHEWRLLASGYHARLGEGHAEVNALAHVQNPEKLKGAHVFVTLEPCVHQGRTPPCAQALAKLPIASLTYGLTDPNPKVSGEGVRILRTAGIVVKEFEQLRPELEELCEIFLLNMRAQRPFVALKVAMSLDGKIALPDRTSQWITSEESRARVQILRGAYDAVLVGVGTFLHDNPSLNSRDPRFVTKATRVVLLDPEGQSLERLTSAKLLAVRAPENVIVVTREAARLPKGVRVIHLPLQNAEFPLVRLLNELYLQGITSLLVEGGAATYAAFVGQDVADRLYAFVAPKLLGDGLSWLSGWSAGSMDRALRLIQPRSEALGEDVLITGRLGVPAKSPT